MKYPNRDYDSKMDFFFFKNEPEFIGLIIFLNVNIGVSHPEAQYPAGNVALASSKSTPENSPAPKTL